MLDDCFFFFFFTICRNYCHSKGSCQGVLDMQVLPVCLCLCVYVYVYTHTPRHGPFQDDIFKYRHYIPLYYATIPCRIQLLLFGLEPCSVQECPGAGDDALSCWAHKGTAGGRRSFWKLPLCRVEIRARCGGVPSGLFLNESRCALIVENQFTNENQFTKQASLLFVGK